MDTHQTEEVGSDVYDEEKAEEGSSDPSLVEGVAVAGGLGGGALAVGNTAASKYVMSKTRRLVVRVGGGGGGGGGGGR